MVFYVFIPHETIETLLQPYFRCFFFQWIDGPDKFDPRILLFYPGVDHCKRELFTRWVPPPPPNPPPMTEEEKVVASARRLEDPPKCHCGEQAVINTRNELEFICPLRREVSFDSILKFQLVYVCSNVFFL